MSAGTRSIVWPFNDPELKRQWHYINKGDKAVAQTAREGADINVEEAWKLTAGDPKIIVAVVDEREIYAPRPGCEHVGQHQGDDRNHGRR